MSGLELFAAALGVIAVWLTVKQNPWCWPIGLVMVLLYSWIFLRSSCIPACFCRCFCPAASLWLVAVDPLGSAARRPCGQPFKYLASARRRGCRRHRQRGARRSNGPLDRFHISWSDATLTAFSLVAQLWMAQKRLQCWALWCVIDVLYIGFFAWQDLYFTAGLYALFTLIAIGAGVTGAATRRCAHEGGGTGGAGIKRQELARRAFAAALWRHHGGRVCALLYRAEPRDTCLADIPDIARGQLRWEDEARAKQPGLLILDTHLLSNIL